MPGLLEIETLSVDFPARAGAVQILDSVNLSIAAGETVCLVGESGSGKTVTAMSVMRLLDYKGGLITQGSIRFDKRNLAALSQREMSALRGRRIGLVFQEPMTALDPLFTVAQQIIEVLVRHRRMARKAARQHAIALLERVKIPDAKTRIDQYPHQMSGGMRQRVMIAIALACQPKLLIADEPTTALDVTIQAQILALLKDIQAETGMAMLLITHDLGVAASMADRVVVMYAGRVVEDAPAKDLFARPAHPYTRGLLRSVLLKTHAPNERLYSIEGSIPDLADPPSGCRYHPRCPLATSHCKIAPPPLEQRGQSRLACWHPNQAETVTRLQTRSPPPIPEKAANPASSPLVRTFDLKKHYPLGAAWPGIQRPVVRALDGVTFDILQGETLGLVGESGSGKSTLGRLLLQLERPTNGRVEFDGHDLSQHDPREMRAARRHMQMIFQDPYGSIDPRWTIGDTIAEPLAVHEALPPAKQRDRARELLALVGLDPAWERRFPHQLSGGQRQRVAIARAIALHPRLIVADEAVSALDVSVRAQVINLLMDLKTRLGLTYLFIGHDLDLVRHISDRIGVMYLGRLIEMGPAEAVFSRPAHPYTAALIAAIPEPDPTRRHAIRPIEGEIPPPEAVLRGCRFRSRCAAATKRCEEEDPALVTIASERAVACHFPF